MNGRHAAWRYLMDEYDGNRQANTTPHHPPFPPPPAPPPRRNYHNPPPQPYAHQPYYNPYIGNYYIPYPTNYAPVLYPPSPQPLPTYPTDRKPAQPVYNTHKRHNAANQIRPTQPVFYCEVCDKTFNSKHKLDDHIQDDHIPCDEPGCNYSAPLKMMEIHQIIHIKDKNGNPLSHSDEDISLWLANRRAKFPSSNRLNEENKDKSKKSTIVTGSSLLEKMLRDAMKSAFGRQTVYKKPQSAFVPDLPKIALQPLSSLISSDHLGKHSRSSESTLYSYYPGILNQPPPQICKHILNKKICKKGRKCPFAHDLDAYKSWQNSKFVINKLEVPRRPPLIYQLLKDEIERYENILIASLKFISEKYLSNQS